MDDVYTPVLKCPSCESLWAPEYRDYCAHCGGLHGRTKCLDCGALTHVLWMVDVADHDRPGDTEDSG